MPKINTYLHKNNKICKKYLNINSRYDKNMLVLIFNEEGTQVELTFSEQEFKYIRKNKEYIFKIEKTVDSNKCLIELNDNKKEFEIKVLELNYKYSQNIIEIEYIIETDAENKNKIIIEIL